jgi:hypothetical protein
MEKSLKNSFYIIVLIFLLSYGLTLFAIVLGGVFSLKITLYLFIATLISSLITVTILGGLFTSLGSYLVNIRRLYRLNNITHPLLLRLQTEAPGTYHHSILVANLASSIAKKVKADSLLCRVAAYFHDIGKLKNPGFFIENQMLKNENINSEAGTESPLKKARKIIEHVKEGVEMAKEYHLPKEVISIIAQHHGTTLCNYFYELSKEKNPIRTKRTNFRYEGPKPQTKEAVILMMADALEAKIRVPNNLSDIEKLVKELFAEKIKDGQFADSGLSQKEVFKIEQAFVEALKNMYHPRIEYP